VHHRAQAQQQNESRLTVLGGGATGYAIADLSNSPRRSRKRLVRPIEARVSGVTLAERRLDLKFALGMEATDVELRLFCDEGVTTRLESITFRRTGAAPEGSP
jgi:hypothetical protein